MDLKYSNDDRKAQLPVCQARNQISGENPESHAIEALVYSSIQEGKLSLEGKVLSGRQASTTVDAILLGTFSCLV
jgi:hypothetical protein